MRLRDRIETIMKGDVNASGSWLEAVLKIASLCYGRGVQLRQAAYARGVFKTRRLPCTVIAVGNLTVGGTGKTPMTIYLARLIQNLGLGVVVISRGYGGKSEKKGGIVCDGRDILMRPDASGDEPFMIAKQLETVPVLVGRDRFETGMTAIRRFGADVILLDDAFQHRKLARDVDIVLMDAKSPLGNGYLFPRGVLREDKRALERSHAVVFTRVETDGSLTNKGLDDLLTGKPVFQSSHQPYIFRAIKANRSSADTDRVLTRNLEWLSKKQAFAFSGIARNEDFRNTIKNLGCTIKGFASFPDHYRYGPQDITRILDAAVEAKAECMLTTEKDYIRIGDSYCWPMDFVVIGVQIAFRDDAFDMFVKNRLARISAEGN